MFGGGGGVPAQPGFAGFFRVFGLLGGGFRVGFEGSWGLGVRVEGCGFWGFRVVEWGVGAQGFLVLGLRGLRFSRLWRVEGIEGV